MIIAIRTIIMTIGVFGLLWSAFFIYAGVIFRVGEERDIIVLLDKKTQCLLEDLFNISNGKEAITYIESRGFLNIPTLIFVTVGYIIARKVR